MKVTTDLGAGSIVLAGGNGDVALVWSEGGRDRDRWLPPGRYRLRSVRVPREESGTPWAITATAGPKQPPRTLTAGDATPFESMDTVHFRARVIWKQGKLRVGFGITDGKKHGLSILKAGKRVPVNYELRSATGEVLSRAVLRYG